ncbi:DUF6086 family protein [Amycolatopsis cynarae]|uniref:DUF6086 family protein n=1 Tax=Amycolatopsis cynarae TaxID=2995223 RepID=A0ABY7B902_9PSEU|nr:DUF6086 family protein [Amycolatopsis sp. HUAS 11-8]WAL67884.1 DUF6086 family protein [Amycolatopsis sp. HUAS 11-8]
MSQSFDVGERTLWNPSNGPGRLFVDVAKALEPLAELPSGIGVGRWGPGDPDCHGIDLVAFTAFTDALVRRYRESNHLILRSLLEGFVATAIVLVERGGGTVPALSEQPGTPTRDVQIGPGGLAAQAGPDRLAELAAEHSAAMAW